MAPVPIEIQPHGSGTVEIIDDMDEFVEDTMCSCSAGDDNPY